ncbi:MAG: hypothetical protein ACXVIH_10065, partial [Ilumatobacteraceae bacterium]
NIVNANLGNLNNPDLNQLRAAAMPIFAAWAAAVPLRDADGNWHAATPASHPGIAYLASASSPDTIVDFAYQVTEGGLTFWKLASGTSVRDSQSNVIAHPTLGEVLNQQSSSGQWTLLSGDEIAFMERYRGVPLPLDSAPTNPHAMISAMSGFISASVTALNLEAVRLAMQGPLSSYFQGLSYDTAADKFHATTDLQLTPDVRGGLRACADGCGRRHGVDCELAAAARHRARRSRSRPAHRQLCLHVPEHGPRL